MLVLALLASWVAVLPAVAHAELLGSTPEEGARLDTFPDAAELVFNERVTPVSGAARLFPPDGEPVVLGAEARDAAVSIELPEIAQAGSFALAYRVISADGHPIAGVITFMVGDGDAGISSAITEIETTDSATERLVGVLTAIQYLGLLLALGMLTWRVGVVRRDVPVPEPPARAGWALSAMSSVLLIAFTALRGTGGAPSDALAPATWSSDVQPAVVVAAACILASGPAWWLLNRAAPVAMVLAFPALIAPLVTGHTRTMRPAWLMMLSDLVHVVSAAFWVGGLVGLSVLLTCKPAERVGKKQVSRIVARFSHWALASVAALALSGTAMATLVLPAPAAVVDTGYGRTLLLKVAMVLAVVGLAAWNRFVLVPRLRAGDDDAAWLHLRRSVAKEAVILGAVLVVTGFLTNLSPSGHDHSARHSAPAMIAVESQGMLVEGSLTPAARGVNALALTVEYGGEPMQEGEVKISARLPEQDLGPIEAVAAFDPDTAEWVAEVNLPAVGEWALQISARVSRFERPIAVTVVRVD